MGALRELATDEELGAARGLDGGLLVPREAARARREGGLELVPLPALDPAVGREANPTSPWKACACLPHKIQSRLGGKKRFFIRHNRMEQLGSRGIG